MTEHFIQPAGGATERRSLLYRHTNLGYRTDTTVLCHSNLLKDGKGYGIKAPDEKGAYGCCRCHDVLDGRARRPVGMSYDVMIDLFHEGVTQTNDILRRLGLMEAKK